ncbi:MAG TPA: peroxiredoxin-like family protein [Terriglobales bacterium]|nr:peroxiredoxin-like family protein [Terriglobales bacterium]
MAQLSANQQAFIAKGARLGSISLGDMNYARIFREETGITFPLLVDEQRQAYEAVQLQRASVLHILRKDNAIARKRAKEAGHRQHRFGKNPFQLGGSFVFGPGNVDRYAHTSKTFGDNAPIAELLAALSSQPEVKQHEAAI